MKIVRLPLFWKFTIIVVIVVLVYGAINIFLLWNSVYTSFEKEINKRCIVLSKIVSEKVLDPIVYDDPVILYSILDEIKKSDPGIAYIFLLDASKNLIAETYDIDTPDDLIHINNLTNGDYHIEVIKTKHYKHKVIRDIAYPVLGGALGTVRLGLVEEDIRNEVINATRTLVFMIILFLIFGLGGALFFSYLITSPIKAISQKAQLIDLNSIKTEDYKIKRQWFKEIFNIYFHDELDVLVSKFTEMIDRLKNNLVELRKTRDSFIQAEKLASIGTFTAGIGHEINNPLAGIKNCINRISKDPENIDQTKRYINLIDEATDKIENVVRHLLDFSRKQELVLAHINPSNVIDSAIVLTSFELGKRGINIVHEKKCTHIVNASKNHLEQVFVNLILNAQDAIESRKISNPNLAGEISINIHCDNKMTFINFVDNGTGIPETYQNKIFDPFFTSKEVGKGTGLGLYVSFNIIKEHGGDFYFKSTYGSGSVFTIELPVIKNIENEDICS